MIAVAARRLVKNVCLQTLPLEDEIRQLNHKSSATRACIVPIVCGETASMDKLAQRTYRPDRVED